MAYEGQIAGVGDRVRRAGRCAAPRSAAMQRRSAARAAPSGVPRSSPRSARSPSCEFVNGGGTGSLELTAAEDAVTELTAGSGFYAPTLFDNYRSLDAHPGRLLRPAGRAPPGPGGRDGARRRLHRLGRGDATACPRPACPRACELDRQEGAGEVQTPLLGDAAARRLRVGDRVYIRHAKAGELCERFDSLHLVEGDRIVDEVPTYRGEGRTFL